MFRALVERILGFVDGDAVSVAFTTDTSGERPPEQGGWSFGEAQPLWVPKT